MAAEERLVTLCEFSNEIEAILAKAMLESQKIFAAIFKDDAGGMEPQLQMIHGVKLKVRQSDYHAARALLEALEDEE